MKYLYLLIALFSIHYQSWCQSTITVAGMGINTPITLTKQATLLNDKPYYSGVGTVADSAATEVYIYWDTIAPAGWRMSFAGQPYLSSDNDTPLPPGTASTQLSWEPVAGQTTGNTAPPAIEGDVALWVSFGKISAYTKGNNLHVNWTTEKEVNNDHFEIEASADGEQFTVIGKVLSKAENGSSDLTLNYEWAGNTGMSVSILPYFAFVLLLLLFARRKKMVFLTSVAISFIAFSQTGCTKDKEQITDAENYYIRIAQIDKDGTKTYSKIVRVNGQQ